METATRPSYEVTLKVPFYDLDPMQIVWHGNYLKYFDVARSELYDHLGVDLFAFHDRTRYIFPIIRSSVKHIYPLKQGDEFHRVCPKEFEAHGKMVKMGDLRVAFVRTDLESMHKWLRAMRQADIIVQRHSDGHMNIFSGPKGKPFIPEIAFYVGCRENDIMHSRPPNDGDAMSATFATLCKIVREEVDVELTGQAKHWYFHAKAGALHNGSSTHTDKPATTLTLEELEELVRSAVCDAQVRQALLQK